MTSIHNNAGAMVALSTLSNINKNMLDTQSMIATGKKVDSAAQNAAIWAVTTVMEADVDGFNAISESLSLGKATVTVARNASEKITELLRDVKEKVVTAQGENVDRAKIQTDIDELAEQIQTIVGSAQFNGLNLIDGSSTDAVNVISSLDRSSGGVATSSISVARQDLGLTKAVVGTGGAATIAATMDSSVANNGAFTAGFADYRFSGTGAGNSNITVEIGGTSVGSVAIADGLTAQQKATEVLSFLNDLNDPRISATLNGNDLRVTSEVAFDALAFTLRSDNATLLDSSLNGGAFGGTPGGSTTQNVTVGQSSTTSNATDTQYGTFTFTATNTATYDLTVNGEALTQFTAGATSTAADIATAFATNLNDLKVNGSAAQQAAFANLTAVVNAGVLQLYNDGIEDYTVEGSVGVAAGRIQFDGRHAVGAENSTFDANGIGATGSGTAFANVVELDLASGTVVAGDGYSVSLRRDLDGDGTKDTVKFDYVAKTGDDQNDIAQGLNDLISADARFSDVQISAVNNSATSSQITHLRMKAGVGSVDIAVDTSKGGSTAGGLAALDTLDVTSTSSAAQALTDIEGLIQTAIDAAAAFGSTEKRLDIQSDFVTSLVDSMNAGIGALVDTNMEAASARLQALQVQQQLGTQALSIANSAPQNILSLFR